MENTSKQYICVLPNGLLGEKAWWRWDTLSWDAKISKQKCIEDSVLTWKDCLKKGWKCVKVEINIKTL